ncbi:transcription elongation factor, putative [Cordyceps militaris CM01]|uniref:Transcription elongation factor 1 homolog n=2 Tax=Cordyceps militaris TaxID=73501 RepID=G3JD98_CORMM|nr:transcription elongation factor, putative [Cordyceps militaris CM01]ATY66705.1 transcription elongation [Cordyceps militaris]EGX92573.1 transcription elongation factor, putative [Cordyceps militaris CM01]
MGKRKSSRKPMGPKRADPLPTTFTCLFCNHEKSVTVKLDRKAGVGQLDCRICGQKFQCAVNYLSAAVDVYGEWVDAAEAVAKEDSARAGYTGTAGATPSRRDREVEDATSDREESRRYGGEGIGADDEDD